MAKKEKKNKKKKVIIQAIILILVVVGICFSFLGITNFIKIFLIPSFSTLNNICNSSLFFL